MLRSTGWKLIAGGIMRESLALPYFGWNSLRFPPLPPTSFPESLFMTSEWLYFRLVTGGRFPRRLVLFSVRFCFCMGRTVA
jgi:hypothetical protein